ncbi:MAG: REP-associated tyrosine transposase [Roseiarcus sp.]
MSPHTYLRRLDQVWLEAPIYFITTCAVARRPLFANPAAFAILTDELATARRRHGWRVGRYVVMPDHLHFFCSEGGKDAPSTLPRFVGSFKEWTAKRMAKATGAKPPIWQPEFFDHVLRSSESYEQKWRYVRDNPVRGGLVSSAEEWPWGGELNAL